MKALFAMCLWVISAVVCAGEMPGKSSGGSVHGTVQEVLNVSNFSYLRMKTGEGEIWAAVVNAAVKKGDVVTIDDAVVMKNFTSKQLKRTFPSIVFGDLRGSESAASAAASMQAPAMPPAENAPRSGALSSAYPIVPTKKLDVIMQDERVSKASGANAYTVAEVFQQAATLKDKPVVVRGKVVKYNPEIMGKNWVHLRDGTGSSADETNDLLVATTSTAKVGDIVTAKGVVHTDKDLGMGYSYKALLEDASLQ